MIFPCSVTGCERRAAEKQGTRPLVSQRPQNFYRGRAYAPTRIRDIEIDKGGSCQGRFREYVD